MRVDFFTNGLLLGSNTNSPRYPTVFAWPNPASGICQITAICSDVTSRMATSSVVTVFGDVGPPLAMTRSDDQSMLHWFATASGIKFFTAFDLTPPVVWSPWTNTIQTNAGLAEAVVPPTGSNQFFQLRTQ